MGKKKKLQRAEDAVYTVRALGKELRMAIPRGYWRERADGQLLTDRFPLLEALARQDHHYATYPLSPEDIVVVRYYGAFWDGADNPTDTASYEVNFHRLDPKTWETTGSNWCNDGVSYAEADFMALMQDAGIPLHEQCWLAVDVWEYQNAQRRAHYHDWFLGQVRAAKGERGDLHRRGL